jgi:hypothetical protein
VFQVLLGILWLLCMFLLLCLVAGTVKNLFRKAKANRVSFWRLAWKLPFTLVSAIWAISVTVCNAIQGGRHHE